MRQEISFFGNFWLHGHKVNFFHFPNNVCLMISITFHSGESCEKFTINKKKFEYIISDEFPAYGTLSPPLLRGGIQITSLYFDEIQITSGSLITIYPQNIDLSIPSGCNSLIIDLVDPSNQELVTIL